MNSILRQIPQEIFKFFRYDSETGKIYWKKQSGRRGVPGKEAGHANRAGYIEIRLSKKTYLAHRIAWALFHETTEVPPMLDHINNCRADNRIENLRPATAQQNSRNRKPKKTGTSQLKGVSWYSRHQKWQAQIRHEGKAIHLGYYNSQEEAHNVYREAALRLHSEFANLG